MWDHGEQGDLVLLSESLGQCKCTPSLDRLVSCPKVGPGPGVLDMPHRPSGLQEVGTGLEAKPILRGLKVTLKPRGFRATEDSFRNYCIFLSSFRYTENTAQKVRNWKVALTSHQSLLLSLTINLLHYVVYLLNLLN